MQKRFVIRGVKIGLDLPNKTHISWGKWGKSSTQKKLKVLNPAHGWNSGDLLIWRHHERGISTKRSFKCEEISFPKMGWKLKEIDPDFFFELLATHPWVVKTEQTHPFGSADSQLETSQRRAWKFIRFGVTKNSSMVVMPVDGEETSGWDITRWDIHENQEHRTKISGDSQKPQLVQKFDFFFTNSISDSFFWGASLGFNRQPKQMVLEDVSLLGEVWLDRNRWFMITFSEHFAQKCSRKCPEVIGLPWCKKTVATPHFQSGWFVYIVGFFLKSSWGRSFLDFNFWAKKFLYTPWN